MGAASKGQENLEGRNRGGGAGAIRSIPGFRSGLDLPISKPGGKGEDGQRKRRGKTGSERCSATQLVHGPAGRQGSSLGKVGDGWRCVQDAGLRR